MKNTIVLHMSEVDTESAIKSENPSVNVEDIFCIRQMRVTKCLFAN